MFLFYEYGQEFESNVIINQVLDDLQETEIAFFAEPKK